jgi:hypothetical protein
MNSEHIIYCDHLDLFVGQKILVYSFLRPTIARVYYLSISRMGKVFLKIALKLGRISSWGKYVLDYSSPMPQGGGLYFGVHHETVELSKKISNKIVEQNTFLDYLPGSIDRERKIGFIRKAVDIKLYPAILLTLIAEKECSENAANGGAVIFVKLADLFPLFLEETLAAMNIEYLNVIDIKASLLNWIYKFINEQIRVIFQYFRNNIFGGGQNKWSNKPSVAIQHSWGIKKDFRLDDLWWLKYSKLDKSRVVFVFNRSKQPATDDIINEYKEKGYRCAILDDVVNQTSTSPTKRYENTRIHWVVPDILSLLEVSNWVRKVHTPIWQVSEWLIVMSKFRYWQAFMECENVKVYFDVAETSREIAALAADLVGGIKIGYHWSDHSHPRAMLLSLHHVYFVWGKHYQNIMREMGSVSNLARIGCIYDTLDARNSISDSSSEHRKKLKLGGAEYIFAILDRSCHPMSHIPPDYHADFYNQLFDLLESNPKVGLIIKPKYPTPQVFDYRSDVYMNYKKAMASNRMITLDGDRHVTEAGLASDLVVVLGPNSGGIICALQGCNVVSWDPSNASFSPQKEWVEKNGWGDQNIVFHNIEELIEVLETVCRDGPNRHEIGDFSKYRDQIDNFQDGKAGIRVGEFIHEFMIGCDKDLDRDKALQAAFSTYGKKWGDENIRPLA